MSESWSWDAVRRFDLEKNKQIFFRKEKEKLRFSLIRSLWFVDRVSKNNFLSKIEKTMTRCSSQQKSLSRWNDFIIQLNMKSFDLKINRSNFEKTTPRNLILHREMCLPVICCNSRFEGRAISWKRSALWLFECVPSERKDKATCANRYRSHFLYRIIWNVSNEFVCECRNCFFLTCPMFERHENYLEGLSHLEDEHRTIVSHNQHHWHQRLRDQSGHSSEDRPRFQWLSE